MMTASTLVASSSLLPMPAIIHRASRDARSETRPRDQRLRRAVIEDELAEEGRESFTADRARTRDLKSVAPPVTPEILHRREPSGRQGFVVCHAGSIAEP